MKELTLTSTLSGKKDVFKPIYPQGPITLYVCGITPYDYAHVGHGRCYVTFDLLYRLLEHSGYKVLYCRNFTDIDDKLIAKAEKEFGDPLQYGKIAQRYVDAYNQDMKALACKDPVYEPRVTQVIPEIIAFIQELIATGHAYAIEGDVYFSIASFSDYGKLSKRSLDELLVGARVHVNEIKKNPLDFALWKAEAEGMYWESPWGWGRPGWHIECSAMARKFLGEHLDIHGGGMDLIFPHHENEIAQSESLVGCPFARYWIHNAFVRINQEKMSKSLGNFFTLRDVFAKFDPMVVRYTILQHHYRSPLDFSFEELESAQKSYQRLCKLFLDRSELVSSGQLYSSVAQSMLAMLYDDLNTPGMFGIVFENFRKLQDDVQLRREVYTILNSVLGLTLQPLAEKVIEITPEIQALMDEREAARMAKDWSRADKIRAQLKSLGVEVSDKKLVE
ncbi:MAG TPA: cysteine--tRNA ligase [Candidatus Babeliaceae bacterium]|nr:cysteine--tRNA ligase [Candidatus Babeliaceae bacterium]